MRTDVEAGRFIRRGGSSKPLLRHAAMALVLTLGSTGGFWEAQARAQSFPTKPVRLIVPFAAGTAPDVIARILGEQLQADWQQLVTIEGRLGASGNAGAELVARSDADGHTLLVTSPPPLAINRYLFKAMPFKPSDLAIVTIAASAPNVLVAKRALPVSSVEELVAYARSGQAKLNYASSGRGTTPHLTMEWFMSALDLSFVHVPYPKGLAPAINDLLGGHVDVMFANLSDIRAHVQAGNLKALAVASRDPVQSLPGIPTVSKTVPELYADAWYAVAAPGSTPQAVVSKISADISLVLKRPAVAERFGALALTVIGNAPKEASQFVEEDSARWGRLVEKIKLVPE